MNHLILENVSLNFPIIGASPQSLKTRISSLATEGSIQDNQHGIPVISTLRDISLDLREGDRLGLIGHDEAGKSSLLRVMAGIYPASSGKISSKGRIMSTINMSVGMEPEATGYENIIAQGSLLGVDISDIRSKMDEIVEFSELGEHINLPMKTYSSGMLRRLSFATITSLSADILLIDEVIDTADASAAGKFQRRLDEFVAKSGILVLASHDEAMIHRFCDKILWLEKGEVKYYGDVNKGLEKYAVGRSGVSGAALGNQQHPLSPAPSQSLVLWFTGLSGVGKTTLSKAITKKLKCRGYPVVRLDGDTLRKKLCQDLGFSQKDRSENVRRIGEVARLFFAHERMVVVVALISPYEADRARARALFPKGRFIEIHCDCPIEICKSRDPKGLYKKAMNGLITNFTGIDAEYQVPADPELRLPTGESKITECVDGIMRFLDEQSLLEEL